MKKILFALVVLLQLQSYAQTDSVPARLSMHEGVIAFIKGRPYQNTIERDFFSKDFDVALSDTSFTVVRYLATWADTLGKIHAYPVSGSRMTANDPSQPLSALDDMIAFERIIIMNKNREFFAAPTFVINLSDEAAAEKAREGVAFCDAFLKGYKNQVTLSYAVFTTDQYLELTDNSYKLTGFDLILEDEQENETVKTHINGSRIPVEKDEVTRLLKRLRAGDTVTIKNIKAEKEGEILNVRDLIISIK
jgi:hypothetical protein